MAFTGGVSPYVHGDLDAVFDERGSTFLTMRRVQWVKEGQEPDPSKAKLELRKWMVNSEGEVPNKGFAFLTEEGPHNLVHTLIENGYGDTKTILNKISTREDFREAVLHMNDDPDAGSNVNGEYFDMRDLLLSSDKDDVA